MRKLFVQNWRPVAAVGTSIAAIALVVSGLSASNALKAVPLIDQFPFSLFKGEKQSMKTLQKTSNIEQVSAENFKEKVLESSVPVLVDFYAEWCGPCKALAPVLEEVARELPHGKIVKVNVDENYELASQLKIDSIPSLFVFKGGRLVDRHVGFADKAALKKLLTR